MRVLMVTPRYLPEMGGIETHVHEVSRRLAECGMDIDIVTSDRSHHLSPLEVVSGVRVHRVPAWPRRSDYYFAPSVYQKVMSFACDLVHVQGYHTLVSPVAMLAAIRRPVPLLITFHSGGHSSSLRNALRAPQWRVIAPMARRAAHCIGVSRHEAEFFSVTMGVPRERFTVIPNGAQMPVLPGAFEPSDQPVIVSIGRLERYKGHHRIIAALPDILRRAPDVRLRVLGEGPYKQRLIDLASRLGVSERVHIGGIPPADRVGVARVLGTSSLVVLLSDYEAHPVAVMESLALRRRVLVTDCSGFKEMIEANMVAAVRVDATAAQITEAVLTHLGQGPLTADVKLPSWDDCADRLAEVYRRVMA